MQIHDPSTDLWDPVFRRYEDLPTVGEAGVEALGDVAHQLDVLALIFPHRHLVAAVGEYVGGLQHWIKEEPGRDQLTLNLRLLLELMHPV